MLKFIRSVIFFVFFTLFGLTISALGIVDLTFKTAFELFILLSLLFSGWIAKSIFDWITGSFEKKIESVELQKIKRIQTEVENDLDECRRLIEILQIQKDKKNNFNN